MPQTHILHLIIETMSPLTHMMGVNGNEALINREAIIYDGKISHIPAISGNALRHRLIRENGAYYIIGACNLAGKLNIDQLNFMFNGGSLVESSVSTNIKRIAQMQEVLPLYRLLGGCLRNQIVAGSLNMGRGMLVCRENVDRINKLIPEEFKIDNSIFPAERYVDQYQYTRGDAEKMKDIDFFAAIDELNSGEEKQKSNLMIFNGQSIVTGAMFYCEIVLQNVSDLELGAALHCLNRWNGFIGGQGSRGHGKCKGYLLGIDPVESLRLIGEYTNHIQTNKDKIIGWLFEQFPGKNKDQISCFQTGN
jgi:hypothetical protein